MNQKTTEYYSTFVDRLTNLDKEMALRMKDDDFNDEIGESMGDDTLKMVKDFIDARQEEGESVNYICDTIKTMSIDKQLKAVINLYLRMANLFVH